jgi:hypothetical protein
LNYVNIFANNDYCCISRNNNQFLRFVCIVFEKRNNAFEPKRHNRNQHSAKRKLKMKLKLQVITEILLETFCNKKIEISYVHNVEYIQTQLNN